MRTPQIIIDWQKEDVFNLLAGKCRLEEKQQSPHPRKHQDTIEGVSIIGDILPAIMKNISRRAHDGF
jgi:hypothetical protein